MILAWASPFKVNCKISWTLSQMQSFELYNYDIPTSLIII